MQNLTQPTLLLKPFAESGDRNTIPVTNTDTSQPNLADLTNGFPQITSLSPDNGGLPPKRMDINGLGYLTTTYDYFYQAGGTFTFNSTISTAIGGYPLGSRLWYTDNNGATTILRSTKENNTDNFVTTPSYIGTSWVPEIPALGWNNVWTGNNTFSSITFNGTVLATVDPYIKNTGLATNGTTPASQTVKQIVFTANDDSVTSLIRSRQVTDGRYALDFVCSRLVNGTLVNSSISAFIDSSGSTYATVPTPPANANNPMAVNAEWVVAHRTTTKPTTTSTASITAPSYVVENYKSQNGRWHIVFSDGFIIQGGPTNPNNPTFDDDTQHTVTLIKAFTSTDYTVLKNIQNPTKAAAYHRELCATDKTTTSFKTYASGGGTSFIAFGY